MEAVGDRTTRRLRVYADFRATADPIERVAILGEKQRLLVAADKEASSRGHQQRAIWPRPLGSPTFVCLRSEKARRAQEKCFR